MLNSEMQVKTVWALKISPVNTYVIKVAKLISAEELKKKDMKMPWTKFSFRNHLSSSLLIKMKMIIDITLHIVYFEWHDTVWSAV